jgi:hypothetical protein
MILLSITTCSNTLYLTRATEYNPLIHYALEERGWIVAS